MQLNEGGVLVRGCWEGRDNSTFSASVFSANTSPQESQLLELRGKESEERQTSLWLSRIWSESIKPKSLHTNPWPSWNASTCAERAGWGDCWNTRYRLWKVLANGRDAWRLKHSQCHFSLQKEQEGSGKLRAVSLTSDSGKTEKQLVLDPISIQLEEKVIRSNQHGFTKGT